MNTDTHILLSRLKLQPRHGIDPEDRKRQLEEELAFAIKSFPTVNALTAEYAAILEKVSTAEAAVSMGLGKVIGIQQQYQKQVISLVKNITFLEESNKELNKSFGLTSAGAEKFGKQLRTLGHQLGLGEDIIFQYAKNLKELAGLFTLSEKNTTGFQKRLYQGQQLMINQLGLTDEAAQSYELYATSVAESGVEALAIQNKMANAIAKSIGLDTNEALAVQKDITNEIAGLSADLQLQYSRIPGSLELAVLKSKALGLNMQNLQSAGENLLNIESSIGQELEYQLLSGQRLLTQDNKSLTNEYRMATLQGDANKQAELMNQLIKTQGPILEKNMLARKKAAELMGIDEATLARSIQKQKLISKLGAERLMELKSGDITAVAAELKTKGVKEEDIKQLLELSDTRTTAEKANNFLKEIESNTKNQLPLGTVSKAGGAALAGAKQFENLITQFDSMKDVLGSLAIFGETTKAVKEPLATLSANIPVLGEYIQEMNTYLDKLIPGTNLQTGAIGQEEVSVKDALIVPDRGPILRPAPNDVIAAFRPGDVVDRTLNNAPVGTAMNIDYAKLASAIATAMSRVKVEATVKTDTLLAATRMNSGKSLSNARS